MVKVLSKSKLKRLEEKAAKKLNTKRLLPLPSAWEEFVGLTKIRSGGQIRTFNPFDYQKRLIQLGETYSKIVCVKGRQLGATQTIISKFLYDACVNPAASSIAFMRNADDASALSRRCRQMLSSIEDYAESDNDNVGYLKVANGGDLYFRNSSKEGSRSLDSATGMLFDEAAFVANIAQIYAASSPSGAMSRDACTKYIVSTPSNKTGWYWEQLAQDNGKLDIEELCLCVSENKSYKAKDIELHHELPGFCWFEDQAGVCKIIMHYLCHPIYNQVPGYLEERLKEDGTDIETVQREYNLRFVNKSVAVFNVAFIKSCARTEFEDNYDPTAIYYAGIDTATTGNDYCVCIILKYKNRHFSVAHVYAKRKQTSEFHIYQITELLVKYRVKRCGIEVTGGVGQVYWEELSREFRNNKFGTEFERLKTTTETKAIRINALVLALEKTLITYPRNCALVEELLSFQRDGSRYGAVEGKHDDEVMGLSFAYDVATSEEEVESRKQNYLNSLNSEEKLEYYQELLEENS